MTREEKLEKFKKIIFTESTTAVYYFDEAIYYRYEWLNEGERTAEILCYKLTGDEEVSSKGEIVPLGRFYKAEKNGEKIK